MCLTPPACRRRRRRAGGTTWVYVRCDCERLRYDLKNPSTSVDAESLALNGTTDALTRRWSARAASGRQKTYSHHPPTPPYCARHAVPHWGAIEADEPEHGEAGAVVLDRVGWRVWSRINTHTHTHAALCAVACGAGLLVRSMRAHMHIEHTER